MGSGGNIFVHSAIWRLMADVSASVQRVFERKGAHSLFWCVCAVCVYWDIVAAEIGRQGTTLAGHEKALAMLYIATLCHFSHATPSLSFLSPLAKTPKYIFSLSLTAGLFFLPIIYPFTSYMLESYLPSLLHSYIILSHCLLYSFYLRLDELQARGKLCCIITLTISCSLSFSFRWFPNDLVLCMRRPLDFTMNSYLNFLFRLVRVYGWTLYRCAKYFFFFNIILFTKTH